MATTADDLSAIRTGIDHVECYRTMGRRCDLTGGWKLLIRGRVVQARPDNLRRKLLKTLLCQAMKATESQLNSPVFRDRLDSFLVLTCPKTRVSLRFGDRTLTLRKRSKSNGMFQQVVTLSPTEVDAAAELDRADPTIRVAPVVQGADEKDSISPVASNAYLIPPVGVSVITDIDDTVKVTRVGHRHEMLANTFVNPFQAVPGMRDAYLRWKALGCAFHYVSSSPWQLYRPLVEFIDQERFPAGSLHLRTIKLQGPSILRLMAGGKRSKKKEIRSVMAWYPGRQFVLVGDAGENDPEIYGSIARKHPVQVAGIFIRRLESANMSAARFERAFRRLPTGICHIFDDPQELSRLMPVERDGILRWGVAS